MRIRLHPAVLALLLLSTGNAFAEDEDLEESEHPKVVGPLSDEAAHHLGHTKKDLGGSIDGADRGVGATPGQGFCNGAFCSQAGRMAGAALFGSGSVLSEAERRLESARQLREKIFGEVQEGVQQGRYTSADADRLKSAFQGDRIPEKSTIEGMPEPLHDAGHGLRTVEHEIHELKDTIKDYNRAAQAAKGLGDQLGKIAQNASSLTDPGNPAAAPAALAGAGIPAASADPAAQYPAKTTNGPGGRVTGLTAASSDGATQKIGDPFRAGAIDNGDGSPAPSPQTTITAPDDGKFPRVAGAAAGPQAYGDLPGGPRTHYPEKAAHPELAAVGGVTPGAGSATATASPTASREPASSAEPAKDGASGESRTASESWKPADLAPGKPNGDKFTVEIAPPGKGKLSDDGALLFAGALKGLQADLTANKTFPKAGTAADELAYREHGYQQFGEMIFNLTQEATAGLDAGGRDLFQRVSGCIRRRSSHKGLL